MFITDLPDQVEAQELLPAKSYGIATNEGPAVSVATYEGRLLVVLSAEAAAAGGTMDLAIQEREDTDDSWGAIPADALQEVDGDTAATFAQVTDAAASFQVKAIDKSRVKAQLRAVATVAGAADVLAAILLGQKKYS